MKKENKERNFYKLIYNPNAGKKKNVLHSSAGVTLEGINSLLKQYQIGIDYAPTKGPGHATELARASIKEGYKTVLVAGGDGTVSEVSNGLIGSKVTLGIIPMGTFMNIARMLSIPLDIEKAIELIKIGRTRKIDVGSITLQDGEKLSKPYYFLETAGLGIEAEVQKEARELEKGNISSLFKIISIVTNFYKDRITLITENGEFNLSASLISIANGPYTGPSVNLAPSAKLNDHRLTITIYKMKPFELLFYLLKAMVQNKTDKRRLKVIQAKKVRIISKRNLPLHADATIFGKTPAEFKIIPNAFKVICGFPESEEDASLNSRTILDP